MSMENPKSVSLDDLVGEHVLDGVDTYIEKVKTYGNSFEDASVIRFRLDGIVYVAFENPEDDYRSSMDRLIVSQLPEMTNVFPAIRVLAKKKANRGSQVNDTLELIDMVTCKVVMEVGTDNTADYYPSFVSNFQPENMATNQTNHEHKMPILPPSVAIRPAPMTDLPDTIALVISRLAGLRSFRMPIVAHGDDYRALADELRMLTAQVIDPLIQSIVDAADLGNYPLYSDTDDFHELIGNLERRAEELDEEDAEYAADPQGWVKARREGVD